LTRQPEPLRRPAALVVLLLAVAGAPLQAAEWKFDVLKLRNGRNLNGLLVEENAAGIRFQCIRQSAGQRTFVFSPAVFHRSEIDTITKLDQHEREQLAARIQALDPAGSGEQRRMSDLELKVVPWNDKPKAGLSYESEMFVLISNANEDIVRRAAVRLEDIYVAYSSHLPARCQNAQPTKVILIESLAEYQKWIKTGGGPNILNLAYFDRARNQVVCASDLKEMGADLARMRREYAKIREECNKDEAELDKLYGKGKGPESFRQAIWICRRRMDYNEKLSEKAFDTATRRLFQTLYHEAFHAYLDNFVYPPREGEVARWLNEGLAQIFESGIVEAGELRVGHADAERLTRAKTILRSQGTGLVPLADLLRSGPRQFLVQHGSDQQVSNSYYLTSWALAFFLTFDRHLLGTPKLDEYVTACKRGTDPLEAFRDLTGEPLSKVEKDFHEYVLKLRPDGTTGALLLPKY
jgi:hypothetical protein